jgi:L-Ala-D/L-Glu epimerase
VTFEIQSIQFQPYCVAFREPFYTAFGMLSYRQGFVIEVSDFNGHIGLGEASPLDGFGMESLAETEKVLRVIQRSLIYTEIQNLQDIQNVLSAYDRSPAAKHGIELALLNLFAQVQDLSLSQILANSTKFKVRNQVPVNAVIGAIAPELAASKAQKYIDKGYHCLKIKVGTKDFDSDIERIKAVRSQVGNDIQIRIDANQGWAVQEAIANLKALESLQIEYVEQPVIALDLNGMAMVRRSQSIPVAADESVNNLVQLQCVIATQSADIIIVKPMALGGILTAHRAALMAFQADLDVVVTTTIDAAIASRGAFELAASLPIKRACGLATGHLLADDYN